MTLQKQILLVFILLSIGSLAQDVQNPLGVEILCSLDWPTRPETCLQVYAPVCASYPRQCLVPPCPQVQDFPSNCIACQDPNVESYRPGACAFVCEANAALITDQPFSPVCAIYQEGCNNPTCRKSFRNSNAACQDSKVISFTNGVCEGDVLEENEQEIIPEEEVIIIIPPEEEQEQEQEGETETETGAEVIYAPIKGVEILCSVNWPTRPEFCPELYAPVCASYPRACLVPPCPQVQQFPSNCFACQNPNVQSYRPGACEVLVIPPEEEEEEAVEGIIIEEELIWDEETILVENEEEEQSSNDFYVGIPCDDPRPEICSEQNDPVCIIECADNVCRRTASSACNACLDPNVLIYTPQSCEVERIQCTAQDLSATNFACTDLYDPVCAYSRDCEGDACSGTTASNDCYACTIQGADYYIRGGCPGSSAS